LGIIGNYWELLGIIGNYWELLGIIGNYWELLGIMIILSISRVFEIKRVK
jgi:hypothetical protein